MKLVPIYLNPRAHTYEVHDTVRVTPTWLNLPRPLDIRKLPPGPKHSFSPMMGHSQSYGLILAPSGSKVIRSVDGQVLAVPTATGMICLSAADAAEQASVEGCRLKWATGVPEAWKDVKGAAS